MARILHNGEWYEEIASRGHYESEFERVVEQESDHLFTKYHLVPFKTTVVSVDDADARQPDFALIHKSYRTWWVVEVELAHHSFERHVLPQVRTLSRANYGQPEIDYLCQQNPELERCKVIEMFKGEQPRLLVLVNAPVEAWVEHLRSLKAAVLICQLFRSRLNKYVLRLNGEYPSEDEEVVTTCECDTMLHRMLVIHAPTQLPIQNGERVLLYRAGQASEWERVDTAGRVYLHALRDHSLRPGRRYHIAWQADETLVIKDDVNQEH